MFYQCVEAVQLLSNHFWLSSGSLQNCVANLAPTYYSQGRWSDAEKLGLEVLEQRRRILGMEHPHTLTAAANLALTYHSQGQWSDAEKLGLEVLEQRRRISGMEHPSTVNAAANLAAMY